jgi:hypothetical protein
VTDVIEGAGTSESDPDGRLAATDQPPTVLRDGADDLALLIKADKSAAPGARHGHTAVVSSRFALTLGAVAAITVLLFLLDVLLVLVLRSPCDDAAKLMNTLSSTATLGFGAIVGLLGGKVA